MNRSTRFPSPLLLLGLAACGAPRDVRHDELGAISAQHTSELARFREAQADCRARFPVPQRLEFAGVGTLLVQECALRGFPGDEELRLKFTYVNTSGRTLPKVRVRLRLFDPDDGSEWSSATNLELPFAFRITPDSSYTTWFEVPARSLAERPHWQWELDAQAAR